VRARFDMDGDYRLAQMRVCLEALVAQLHAVLIFALCAKTAVTLMAGADLFVVRFFRGVNFRMNFDHCYSPEWKGQTACHVERLKTNDLFDRGDRPLRDITQNVLGKSLCPPWLIERILDGIL